MTATTASDERQPLLPRTTDSEPQSADNVQEELIDSDATAPPKADDLNWRAYTFYGVVLLAGLIALSLLIKGFIDSGEKEVRRVFSWHLIQALTLSSLTLSAH